MAFKMYRKYQRRFNKAMRALNKSIVEDELWRGRFEMRLKSSKFKKFSDNSGGVLYATMRLYDKKTGYYKDYFDSFGEMHYRLFYIMNDFITNKVRVWEELPRPSVVGAEDFTKVHVPDEIMRKEINDFWF